MSIPFQTRMNEDYYVECRSCGFEFYSTNEDDHVFQLCDMCSNYGGNWSVERGNYDYCNHEDYPCCGCN
jgi:hypothetical protein